MQRTRKGWVMAFNKESNAFVVRCMGAGRNEESLADGCHKEAHHDVSGRSA